MTKVEKQQEFWKEHLNAYQEQMLKKAMFKTPEELYDLPIVFLTSLKNFGFSCTLDTFKALYEYFETSDEDMRIELKKLFDYYSNEDDLSDFDYDVLKAVYVDEILFSIGYDTAEKISLITFRELLNLNGVNFEVLIDIAKEVITVHNKTYVPPIISYETKYDLKNRGYLLFQVKRYHNKENINE